MQNWYLIKRCNATRISYTTRSNGYAAIILQMTTVAISLKNIVRSKLAAKLTAVAFLIDVVSIPVSAFAMGCIVSISADSTATLIILTVITNTAISRRRSHGSIDKESNRRGIHQHRRPRFNSKCV